jgi:hypothetical protein
MHSAYCVAGKNRPASGAIGSLESGELLATFQGHTDAVTGGLVGAMEEISRRYSEWIQATPRPCHHDRFPICLVRRPSPSGTPPSLEQIPHTSDSHELAPQLNPSVISAISVRRRGAGLRSLFFDTN